MEYDGNHPALVDVTTFRQVQRVLVAHRQSGERSHRHGHYLKGSLVCGNCGSRLGLTMSRGKLGVIYPYFYCLGRNKRRTACDLPFLPVELVESAVADYYRHVRLSPNELATLRTHALQHIERYDELAARERDRQTGRLARLKRERKKLLEAAHYAEAIPLDLLKEEQARVAREQTQAESIIRHCQLEVAHLKAALQDAWTCSTTASASTAASRRRRAGC